MLDRIPTLGLAALAVTGAVLSRCLMLMLGREIPGGGLERQWPVAAVPCAQPNAVTGRLPLHPLGSWERPALARPPALLIQSTALQRNDFAGGPGPGFSPAHLTADWLSAALLHPSALHLFHPRRGRARRVHAGFLLRLFLAALCAGALHSSATIARRALLVSNWRLVRLGRWVVDSLDQFTFSFGLQGMRDARDGSHAVSKLCWATARLPLAFLYAAAFSTATLLPTGLAGDGRKIQTMRALQKRHTRQERCKGIALTPGLDTEAAMHQ